jgi:hypothetical protein
MRFTKRLYGAIATAAAAAVLSFPAPASALTFDFLYNQPSCPSTWGTMTVGVVDADTLSIGFSMTNPGCLPAGSAAQATGFGFNFGAAGSNPGLTISNPLAGAFADDQDSLNWIVLNNLGAIPNPANSTTIDKTDFWFGATEGNANNINPPGIAIGQFDLFYIDGFTTNLTAPGFQLADFVDLVGVRYQSLPDNINGGSLFLVGTPDNGGGPPQLLPEPSSVALLGALGLGMFAAGALRRRNAG